MGWLVFAAIVYMIWYIYRGMRNYYAQGRALTLTKYFTLGFSYLSPPRLVPAGRHLQRHDGLTAAPDSLQGALQ